TFEQACSSVSVDGEAISRRILISGSHADTRDDVEAAMSRRVVAVMGSDLSASDDQRAAEALGEALANEGWVVLTGGRIGAHRTSVMHLVLGGAKRVANSVTVGVLPYERDNEQTSPHADIRIFTGMNNARNAINVLTGDVVIGFGRITPGTASEIALA